MSENDAIAIAKIRNQGVYYLPAGGVTDDLHLAGFHESTSRRVIVDKLIYPEECEGVPCVPLGSRFLVRIDALHDWVKQHERPQVRPQKKGGTQCRDRQGEPGEEEEEEV